MPVYLFTDETLIQQGGVESIFCLTESLKLEVVPYVVLFIVPVLGRLSDPDPSVRFGHQHNFYYINFFYLFLHSKNDVGIH